MRKIPSVFQLSVGFVSSLFLAIIPYLWAGGGMADTKDSKSFAGNPRVRVRLPLCPR